MWWTFKANFSAHRVCLLFDIAWIQVFVSESDENLGDKIENDDRDRY